MAVKVGIYMWLTLPPGMTPERAVAEVRSSVEFGQADIRLQFVQDDGPGERMIMCTCRDPDHEICDDPRWHISCGCRA